ncbi:two-component sensor histidine kinase [Paenibacillus baekrokdamisoli]|uniref:histidine kinase n=2 Tax=Paenibacillus baekrokdamisoli TaxID=1712516 RepID=A0A3G9J3R6_9BACL|nr:histidine kinase N-terminal 7TM domain-containing protein [Paenibacillus baekrokdamisoli]MBB3067958.1 PAS domain S-box-containing protein [Paenibacillus baekrokdamisoli]BBH22995.1 two-component sensor histidine kinase [Paenibacillus baekrokdamisoli]
MNYNLYLSALLMAATCCSLVMSYLSWKRRELPIAISYGLGMLAGSFYTFGYAFEIVSNTLEHIRFWLRVEYIGIPFGTVLWFVMVLQYTGRQWFVRKRNVGLLMVVPLLTFAAHYTNDWHHWFYKSMTINESEGFPLVSLVKGPLYEVHVAYSYTLFAIGMGLMIQMFRKATPRMKKQIALMMIGSWGPYGFTIVYLSGVIYMPIDLSPFGFVFSGVFYMWGIYQFNMLRLAPLALQKVFESMQDAVIVFDLDNSLTSYNQSANRIIKGLNKKVLGQPADQLFSHYPVLLERIMQEPSSGSKVQFSGQADDKYYNVHLSIVSDNNQKPVGKMLLLSDVTETVRSEERMLDHARQLSELNTFKDKMFSVVAHDIRDPLAVLINLIELMEEEMQACGEDHEEIVHEMRQQIQNTFTLVESLLDWFRSQREGMIFNPVERDLAHAVQTALRLLLVRSEGKRIQIISEIPKGNFVYADKEMLDLIIRNLLSNAIKFTDSGGSIRLRADRKDDKMVISVSDTGEGISSDQANNLLQEAFPISSVGTAGERGVGLGLTLCREFVRLNGGDIWFDSSPTLGSTFYFSIPVPSEASSTLSSSMEGVVR